MLNDHAEPHEGSPRIVLLRHVEKPANPADPHLSAAGQARAHMLATLIPNRFGKPDFLFAAAPSPNSVRPVETLEPLSQALELTLDTTFADRDFASLAESVLTKAKYADKLVVICWHHGKIPALARALGIPAEGVSRASPVMTDGHWDPDVFDVFWSILQQDGRAQLLATTQKETG